MLPITIPQREDFNNATQEFIVVEKEQKIQLEHSLLSLSKWESKWHKPFIGNEDLSLDEIIDYIRCMTITPNVNPDVYWRLTKDNIEEIQNYIKNPMTATRIKKNPNDINNREIITSEILYYDMIALNIPFECEKWHLNRLITLIEVCSIKSQPQKKMSVEEIYAQNRELNKQRRLKLKSKG